MDQINTLYILNLYNVIYQLYLNKAGRKKEIYIYIYIYIYTYTHTHTHTHTYNSDLGKKEILPFATTTTWMDVEDIMLSEIS